MNITDKIKITQEDNMELMARYPDGYFELAIVDPPYGINFSSYERYGYKGKEHLTGRYKKKKWDDGVPDETYFNELKRVSKNQIVWGGNYFPCLWDNGCKGFVYWHKGNPVKNFSDGELAWTSFDSVAKQYDYRYYGNLQGKSSAEEKIHPTQKPVALYEWLLMNYAKQGDKILDTHLGSGSIAIACHNLGFELTACELDKDYYEAACKRIKDHVSNITMFDIIREVESQPEQIKMFNE